MGRSKCLSNISSSSFGHIFFITICAGGNGRGYKLLIKKMSWPKMDEVYLKDMGDET